LISMRGGLGVGLALVLGGAMAYVSQGCTIVASDAPLDDGGLFSEGGGDVPQSDGGAQNEGGASACDECLFQSCAGQWAVCQQSSECMAIYFCSTAASCDQNCIDNCFAAHPTGQNAYYALASCDLATACGTCTSTCMPAAGTCAQPDGGTTPEASTGDDGGDDGGSVPEASTGDDGGTAADASVASCSDCTAATCASQKAACATGSDCDKYTQCLAMCTDVTCVSTCGTTFAAGQMASQALGTCVSNGCKSQCGL